MNVGDLVVHVDAWKGYLFLVVEIDTQGTRQRMCRCTIVRSPETNRGYEVGYTIRWKYVSEFKPYKKK